MDISFKRRIIPFLALAIGLSLGTVGCGEKGDTGGDSAQSEAEGSKLLATVNGKNITEGDLSQYRSDRPNSAQMHNQDALLNELVQQEVVYQDALRQNLDEDPQFIRDLERMRTRLLVSAAVQNAIDNAPVSDESLRKEYDKLKERMVTTEYKAGHILVEDEEQANSLIKQLDQGADFAELAKKHSTDSSSAQGGDLGWVNPQQMVPSFSAALEQLEKGSYSKQPVKTPFGWHIIKLDDSRQTEPPAFEQIKPRLMQMVKQRYVGEYIEGLVDKAEISYEGKEEESTAEEADAEKADETDTSGEEKTESPESK